MTESENSTGPAAKRCSCGHDRSHPDVGAHARYGFWGWIALGMGASAVPRRLDFVCRRCHETFDSTTDPAEVRRHI